jgi:ligand-binding sensor domain-containing protein
LILKKVILIFRLTTLLLLDGAATLAQPFTTRLYTTSDGLSDNYILSVYQDSYGYMWIGTANGLSRFDGKRFTTFGVQQGLPSVLVDRMYEDRHHRFWIGTRSGIAELKGDTCYTYPVSDKQLIGFVSSFFEPDTTRLWATTNRGLYELRNNMWVKISLCPGFENASIGKIISANHSLYINYNNNKLMQLDAGKKVTTLLSVQSNRAYYNSMCEVDNQIYIGTYSALLKWEQNKWLALFDDTLKKKYIYLTYHDKKNRWWFGTEQDGVLVAIPDREKTIYTRIPLSFNLVSQFFEDRDGNMWVAGFQGLLKISPSYYKTFSMQELDKMHFIRNCIEIPSGNLIVSGENGQLLVLKPAKQASDPPRIIAAPRLKEPGDFIDHYTFDEKERMWFTTRGGKLYRLEDARLKDFNFLVKFKNGVFRDVGYNKRTKQLYVCGDSVFLAGSENGLDTFFSKNNEFVPIPGIIYTHEEAGCILVQTIENGLFLITKRGEIRAVKNDVNLATSIAEDEGENKNETVLWAVQRGKGIFKYRWVGENDPVLLETINEKNGLSNNSILSIATDNQKKLWIATSKGITIMEKNAAQEWIHQDFQINTSANESPLSFSHLCSDRYGKMWMNVGNKLLAFDTKSTTIVPARTNSVIEKVLLYNQPTDWASLTDSVESYRSVPVNPVLRYNQNNLSIVFNSPQYNDISRLEYSYRLQPSDTAWSSPTPGNLVSFYQLTPGNYKFEVRSHNTGFEWSKPAAFSFIITKPYWEAWWFRALVILLAAAFIVLISRYRLLQLRARTEMQKQLQELETKAFKLQMNPHFIHNALNSIQSLVINNKANEATVYISKFAKLLRQVLENSEKNLVSLDKELYSLQLYVDLERLRMNMDVDYNVVVDESLVASETKIPPLILQPFVENALWHGLSRKEGDKVITINISLRENWLMCEITDNGIGRKKAAQAYETFPEGHLSKAVNIIQQRLADFNQSAHLEPVRFTDLEDNGRALGTTVIIRVRASFTD